jgi:hypothetical protein
MRAPPQPEPISATVAPMVGFRNGSNMVFQLLLSQRIDSVPITRDFMMVGARSSRTSGDPN